MEAIPKGKKYRLNIAFCLAIAINHLSVCKKRNDNLVLDHKVLSEFYIWHKHISRYLRCFEQAGLIEVTSKKGAAPRIKLLLLNSRGYIPNYKQNKYEDKKKYSNSTKGT